MENVVDCHAENIIWIDDLLGFTFQKSTTDQISKNAILVWHIYTALHNPITCPILVLAYDLFSNPRIPTLVPTSQDNYDPINESDMIDPDSIEGNISINRYSKLFHRCIKYYRFMKTFRKGNMPEWRWVLEVQDWRWQSWISFSVEGARGLAILRLWGKRCLGLLCQFFECHVKYGVYKGVLITFWEGQGWMWCKVLYLCMVITKSDVCPWSKYNYTS